MIMMQGICGRLVGLLVGRWRSRSLFFKEFSGCVLCIGVKSGSAKPQPP